MSNNQWTPNIVDVTFTTATPTLLEDGNVRHGQRAGHVAGPGQRTSTRGVGISAPFVSPVGASVIDAAGPTSLCSVGQFSLAVALHSSGNPATTPPGMVRREEDVDAPTPPPRDWPDDWAEEDAGLPIEFGPASNAEYDPEPVLPPVLRETIRRAGDDAERNARRLGMSRREFYPAAGAATTFLARTPARARSTERTPPPPRASRAAATTSSSASVEPPAHGHEALGGEEFVFDIQGHFLEYHLNPVLNGQNFWQAFPQQGCGEDDPRVFRSSTSSS